jgi:hypothetical protein
VATRNERGIMKVNRRLTKAQRTAEKKLIIEANQTGQNLYLFRNRSTFATLSLPKKSVDGKKTVGPANPRIPGSGEWIGDSYFIEMNVKKGEAVIVKEILLPEANQMEEKLILDQPPTVTNQGTVEHVAVNPNKPLNENPQNPQVKPSEVLLTEDPMAGVTIIND